MRHIVIAYARAWAETVVAVLRSRPRLVAASIRPDIAWYPWLGDEVVVKRSNFRSGISRTVLIWLNIPRISAFWEFGTFRSKVRDVRPRRTRQPGVGIARAHRTGRPRFFLRLEMGMPAARLTAVTERFGGTTLRSKSPTEEGRTAITSRSARSTARCSFSSTSTL